jgi:hypothetical protein
MATGSITNDQVDFVETWENVAPMTNFIIKLDVRGEEVHESVSGARKFTLTTQDRIITQNRILDPKHDPFLNGCFRPIITPEDITIETNPNALSDEDIVRIFGSSQIAWDQWLETVDAEHTLRRMMELAEDHEDFPLKRFKQLQARLAEVSGGPKHATQKDEAAYLAMAGKSSGETENETRKNASKRAMTSSSKA